MGLRARRSNALSQRCRRSDFLAEAHPGRGVRIGPGLARIAASLGTNAAELLRPHLTALSEQVGETVDLSILSGGSVVFVDQIPGRQRLIALSAVGERFPLHCTANGKAILACFSTEDATAMIEKSVAAHPEHTLADRAKLLRELEMARRKHLAFDLGGHDGGIGAVGVATLDSFGRPIAVSIPAPTQRFAARRDELSKALIVVSRQDARDRGTLIRPKVLNEPAESSFAPVVRNS